MSATKNLTALRPADQQDREPEFDQTLRSTQTTYFFGFFLGGGVDRGKKVRIQKASDKMLQNK